MHTCSEWLWQAASRGNTAKPIWHLLAVQSFMDARNCQALLLRSAPYVNKHRVIGRIDALPLSSRPYRALLDGPRREVRVFGCDVG